MDSGKCNDYSTKACVDAHCQGIRIVLDTTFTAGGLYAPIFVVIYGLTPEEMMYNDMVCVPIPGFTVGSERNLYATREGYIVLVRGNYKYRNLTKKVQIPIQIPIPKNLELQAYIVS